MKSLPALLLFTKIPGLTPVKTRLIASGCLAPAAVEALATAFLFDTLFELSRLPSCRLFLASEPRVDPTTRELREILQLVESSGCTVFPQRGSTFAERLENAVRETHRFSESGVVIVGSDAPTVPSTAYLRAADSVLRGNFVLGPAPSGGLYLIGLPGRFIPEHGFASLFADAERTELQCFADLASAASGKLELLEQHHDVDIEDDLVSLISLLEATSRAGDNGSYAPAMATRAALKSLGIRLHRDPDDNRKVRVRSS